MINRCSSAFLFPKAQTMLNMKSGDNLMLEIRKNIKIIYTLINVRRGNFIFHVIVLLMTILICMQYYGSFKSKIANELYPDFYDITATDVEKITSNQMNNLMQLTDLSYIKITLAESIDEYNVVSYVGDPHMKSRVFGRNI